MGRFGGAAGVDDGILDEMKRKIARGTVGLVREVVAAEIDPEAKFAVLDPRQLEPGGVDPPRPALRRRRSARRFGFRHDRHHEGAPLSRHGIGDRDRPLVGADCRRTEAGEDRRVLFRVLSLSWKLLGSRGPRQPRSSVPALQA